MNKKILVLANNANGLYNFRKELLASFIKDGDIVYCSLPFNDNIQRITKLGCECIDIKISRRGTNPFEDFKLFLTYIKLIHQVKPDIVLTYTVKPNIYGGLACQLMRKPYIANITGLGTAIQNSGFTQKLVLTLYKLGLKKATTVFFQNKGNQDFMKNHNIVSGVTKLLPGSGEDNLFKFKKSFYRNDDLTRFSIGKKIFMEEQYEKLVKIHGETDSNFFPKYRSN